MPETSPTMDARANIIDTWSKTFKYEGDTNHIESYFGITTSLFAASCKENDSADVFDNFYIVQVCNFNFGCPSIVARHYGYTIDTSIKGLDDDVDTIFLVDSAPATGMGTQTYSSGISQSISGSLGVFGETPTGNVGYSRTETESHTISIPDVQVMNESHSRGNNARWRFVIGLDTRMATSQLALNNAFLWRGNRAKLENGRENLVIVTSLTIRIGLYESMTIANQIVAMEPGAKIGDYQAADGRDFIWTDVHLPPREITIHFPPPPRI